MKKSKIIINILLSIIFLILIVAGIYTILIKEILLFGNNYKTNIIVLICIIIFLVIIIVNLINDITPKDNKIDFKNTLSAMDEIDIPDFDKEEFLKHIFYDFVKIQESIANNDNDTLKELTTSNFYNKQMEKFENIKKRHLKIVSYDYDFKFNNIASVVESSKLYSIRVCLSLSNYEYIVNNNNEIVKGNNNYKIAKTYILTFVKEKGKSKILEKCPNCNAKLNNKSEDCEYCGCRVVSNSYDWLLDKKELISKSVDLYANKKGLF